MGSPMLHFKIMHLFYLMNIHKLNYPLLKNLAYGHYYLMCSYIYFACQNCAQTMYAIKLYFVESEIRYRYV